MKGSGAGYVEILLIQGLEDGVDETTQSGIFNLKNQITDRDILV